MQLSSYQYTLIHDWLGKTFGKASRCEFCKTELAKRYEYCLLKGKEHEKNRDNYIQLCTSCHRRYDWTPQKSKQSSIRNSGKGNPNFGKKHTKEELEKMSKALKGRVMSKEWKEKLSKGQTKRWAKIKKNI